MRQAFGRIHPIAARTRRLKRQTPTPRSASNANPGATHKKNKAHGPDPSRRAIPSRLQRCAIHRSKQRTPGSRAQGPARRGRPPLHTPDVRMHCADARRAPTAHRVPARSHPVFGPPLPPIRRHDRAYGSSRPRRMRPAAFAGVRPQRRQQFGTQRAHDRLIRRTFFKRAHSPSPHRSSAHRQQRTQRAAHRRSIGRPRVRRTPFDLHRSADP